MEPPTEKRIMLAFESHAPCLQPRRVSEKPQGKPIRLTQAFHAKAFNEVENVLLHMIRKIASDDFSV